jgi:hypothetical protein
MAGGLGDGEYIVDAAGDRSLKHQPGTDTVLTRIS